MIDREKITSRVREVLNGRSIETFFFSIIEEFFVRAVQQYNWREEELQTALNRFSVNEITFKRFENLNFNCKYCGCYTKILGESDSEIKVSVDYLKGILRYDIQEIEDFINVMMHELGHSIKDQTQNEEVKSVGIQRQEIVGKNTISNKGIIMDEFIEIMSAERLQKGNLRSGQYCQYENIQTVGKVILSSLG